MTKHTIEIIGTIKSCFKEKFTIPRQSGLVKLAEGTLELLPDYSSPESVRELEKFSHIWLIFLFHQNVDKGWSPTVRPPRLGGNKRVGVFASRSPFRPNPIGLSLVELKSIEHNNGKTTLKLAGVDLMDGTPIIDIKPYIPEVESVADATDGWINELPDLPPLPTVIEFSEEAIEFIESQTDVPLLKQLIIDLLSLDPRPAYYKDRDSSQKNSFAAKLFNYDVHWQVNESEIFVTKIEQL